MTGKRQTPAAFTAALRRHMAERNVTFRQLAAETKTVDQLGRGLSHTYLGNIARGTDAPTANSIELVAAALEVDPLEFAEYRLAMVRRLLDEREVGLERALANLRAIEDAVDASLGQTDLGDPPPGSIAQLRVASGASPPSSRGGRGPRR